MSAAITAIVQEAIARHRVSALTAANARIAELEGALDEAIDFVVLVQAFIRRDAGTERMADTLDHLLDSARRIDTDLRAKGGAA